MAEGLLEAFVESLRPEGRKFLGVAIAQVTDNKDSLGQGRVRLRFPWLPNFETWARVAVLSAGNDAGTFFVPQVDDEVLVAFNHGDVRDPFVIGCLWNGEDAAPARGLLDPVNKRMVRTPKGHQLLFDDMTQSIKLESATGQKITLASDKIELESSSGAKVTLDASGGVVIDAAAEIKLKATSIKLEGTNIQLQANAQLDLNGGSSCSVQGGVVRIN